MHIESNKSDCKVSVNRGEILNVDLEGAIKIRLYSRDTGEHLGDVGIYIMDAKLSSLLASISIGANSSHVVRTEGFPHNSVTYICREWPTEESKKGV